jgi:hypothetical protein
LLNLQHNVSLQITDPVVLREAAAGARARQSQVDVESEMVLSSAE